MSSIRPPVVMVAVLAVLIQPGGEAPSLRGATAPVGPPERPIEGNWLPALMRNRPKENWDLKRALEVPTAFPDQKAAGWNDLARDCPLLFREKSLAIDPMDDTHRRLQKARLHQLVQALIWVAARPDRGESSDDWPDDVIRLHQGLVAASLEVWPEDEKNLIPRLNEVVRLAKSLEHVAAVRVKAGTEPYLVLSRAVGHRAGVEAALWSAMRGPPPPATDSPRPDGAPTEGNWLPKLAWRQAGDAVPAIRPSEVPTAFPDLKAAWPLDLARDYPALFGEGVLVVAEADDANRLLLKARLHQCVQAAILGNDRVRSGESVAREWDVVLGLQRQMCTLSAELWAEDEANLIPRLREVVQLAKSLERAAWERVKSRPEHCSHLARSAGHRLEMEAALWKALHRAPRGPVALRPAAPRAPIEGDWLPKLSRGGKPDAAVLDLRSGEVPTLFPDLKAARAIDLEKECPVLLAEGGGFIEPKDVTHRRLLKAQFHQTVQSLILYDHRSQITISSIHHLDSWVTEQAQARELAGRIWSNDPGNLVPRLRELVLQAKAIEKGRVIRIKGGTEHPRLLPWVVGHRLAAESALWRAMNSGQAPK